MQQVYYPLGGRHYLLHWWSYNERGHIILASTEASAKSTAASVFRKHSDAEIRAYSEVEIVAPSELMHKQAAKFDRQEDIYRFHQKVMCRLREVIKAGKALPPQFSLCASFEPDHEIHQENKEWAEEGHYSCKNCTETIRLVNITAEELYDRYASAWKKLHPTKTYIDPKRVPSRATPAQDGEELYFACAAFGHHCPGIEILRTELEPSHEDYRPRHISSNLIFLYRKLRDLDVADLQDALIAQKKIRTERAMSEVRERVAKRKQDEVERIESVLRVFEEE